MFWCVIMAINSYLNLRAAISGFAKRGDIESEIDTFISLAESDIWQRLRIKEMDTRAIATTSTATRFIPLPENFLEMRKLVLFSGSQSYPLQYVTPESIDILPSNHIPSDYTITSQVEFNCRPAGNYTADMQYFRVLPPLSLDNQTNSILTLYPMVYLYGSLMHFGNWSLNDELTLKYANLFKAAIDQANRNDKKGRFGPAKAMRREMPTP